MMQITIKQESGNFHERGYGVYINAYITDEWDNELQYATECVPFGKNTPEELKRVTRNVRRRARRAYRRDYMQEN